jgi:hypothetical protein
MQRLESLEAILSPLSRNSKLEETGRWASRQHMPLLPEGEVAPFNLASSASVVVNPLVSDLIPPLIHRPMEAQEEEFELHLIRLGMLYSNLSTNYRLSLMQGQEYQHHQKSIHHSLRMALCANGVFYSHHPYLLSLLEKENLDTKASFAKRFLDQAEKMLPNVFINEMELIDSVRALLMIIDGYVALGDPVEASRVNSRISFT